MALFVPVYEGPIEGWVVNYLKKNFWRVKNAMEYEDLMGEAYLLFLELGKRYTDIDNPKWFMAMFQRCFMNRIADLSSTDSDLRKNPTLSDLTPEEDSGDSSFMQFLVDSVHGDLETDGMVEIMLDQAPDEIKQTIRLILNMPSEILSKVIDTWKERGKKKELGNQMICAMLGMDHTKVNLVSDVYNYFHQV